MDLIFKEYSLDSESYNGITTFRVEHTNYQNYDYYDVGYRVSYRLNVYENYEKANGCRRYLYLKHPLDSGVSFDVVVFNNSSGHELATIHTSTDTIRTAEGAAGESYFLYNQTDQSLQFVVDESFGGLVTFPFLDPELNFTVKFILSLSHWVW